MTTKTIPLADASGDQLRAFAESYLGITFPATATENTMRAKISGAWTKPEIHLVEAADNGAPDGPRPKKAKVLAKDNTDPKVRVIINISEGPGGEDPVPLGVNGKVLLAPRGEEIELPQPYFEVLEHAVTHRYDTDKDGNMIPIPRKIPLYPYQRIA